MSSPRIVYLGMACTASLPPLAALVAHHHDVRAIFLAAPGGLDGGAAIARLAGAAAIPVVAIPRLNQLTIAAIAAYQPELIVAACFPWRLPAPLLTLPGLGCVNVHPSLLPVGRGPEPLFWTLRRGERQTGITLHRMNRDFDTGPILAQTAIATPVGRRAADIEQGLMTLGGELLVETLPRLVSGESIPRPQDDALATYAPIPTGADFVVPTNLPAAWAYNFVRGVAEFGGPLRVLSSAWTEPLRVRDALNYAAEAAAVPPLTDEGGGIVQVRFTPGTVRFVREHVAAGWSRNIAPMFGCSDADTG